MTDSKLIFEGSDWTFADLHRMRDAIEPIALEDLKLDVNPNEFQIVSSEQMLDSYSSIGMPLMYRHWSFGKRFARDDARYKKGLMGLSYEMVINSKPCINYLMEDNTAAMQCLVIAHAAYGHNHFFKNNHLFREWTRADYILDYLAYAKGYVEKCEERFGIGAVERILDAAHALMNQGVDHSQRPSPLSQKKRIERMQNRQKNEEERYNHIYARTVPPPPVDAERDGEESESDDDLGKNPKIRLPEENILYFLEKYSPGLKEWQRELIRIVRCIAQYFYPQRQTKMMNEGCATFVHYYILSELWSKGLISQGTYMEMLHSHTSVIFQPDFDDRRYAGGLNPYALGFAMMTDIKRVVTGIDPVTGKDCSKVQLAEDREYLPHIAGTGDWRSTLKHAWANFRDESFVTQFLSPKVVRDFHLFSLRHGHHEKHYEVEHIHDREGFRGIRKALSNMYSIAETYPDLQVVDASFSGDRSLLIQLNAVNDRRLEVTEAEKTLQCMQVLWKYPITIEMVTEEGKKFPIFTCKEGNVTKVA